MDEAAAPAIPHPRQASLLFGHAAAEAEIAGALSAGRLAHAWLITGPPGIGKATLAFRFARYLLKNGAVAPEAGLFGDEAASLAVAEEDPVFRRVAAGGEPNLRVVERRPHPKTGKMRTAIDIDQIRETVGFLRHTSVDGGQRVVIVDCVDDLNTASANALLKILEEPPARSFLILVNHAPGRVLPTIRSRCRTLALAPLETDVVAEVLGHLRPDLPETTRLDLAALAEGSAKRALDLLDGGATEVRDRLAAVLETCPDLDLERATAFAETVGRQGGPPEVFAAAADLLSAWIAAQARSGAVQAGDGSDSRCRADLDRWARLWEKSARQFRDTEALNLDRKLVLLETFFDIRDLMRASNVS